MEVTQTSTPESQSTVTPQASEPTSAPQSAPESTQPASPAGSDVPQAPVYQPNFKFSVLKKEHEIPEAFRSIIKDQDTEKSVKEIFEKAYGLDHVKGERTKLQEEYKQYRSQTEPVMKVAQTLEYFRKQGDLNSYFRTLGLNKDQIFKWAVEQAEIEGLPDQQKRVYDQQQDAQWRAYQLEQQLQYEQQAREQILVQQRHAELDFALSKPDISPVIKAFDQRNGEGAFKNEVISRGQWYYYNQGVDVPVEQVVSEIMTRFGLNQLQPQPQLQAQSQVQTSSTPKAPQDLPVIPNTGAGTTSPAQRQIRSIDDLNKAYQEKFGA